MKPTPAFWAAVRLTEFANLEITQDNWAGLFRPDLRDLGWDLGRLQRTRQWFREARRMFPVRTRPRRVRDHRGRPVGELWRAYVANVVRYYGRPPAPFDLLQDAQEALQRELGPVTGSTGKRSTPRGAPGRDYDPEYNATLLPFTPLGPWSFPGPRWRLMSYQVLARLHGKTRERLHLICANEADLRPLVRELARYEMPGERLSFPAGSVSARSPFWLEGKALEPTMEAHLDMLFVVTAAARMWGRLFECLGCDRFMVSRLRRDSPRRSPSVCCSPACGRMKRRRERDALRQTVQLELRELQNRRVLNALEVVRKRHNLTTKQLSDVLREVAP